METKVFRTLFSDIAEQYGFNPAFSGWFSESPESITVLDLQKSHFGNYFEMNVKIFVQGMFGRNYQKTKDLVKKDVGHVFRRAPKAFVDVFNLDLQVDYAERQRRLTSLFNTFVVPFATQARTRFGIRKLGETAEVFIPPAIQQALKKMDESRTVV